MGWVSPHVTHRPAHTVANQPAQIDLADDPDDELSIDFMNDSFFLEGVARIMADARAQGATGKLRQSVGSWPEIGPVP